MKQMNQTVISKGMIVNSLSKGLSILNLFSKTHSNLSVTQISRMLNINKTTAYRLVTTLKSMDFLIQDEKTKLYRLGPRVIQIGFEAVESLELRQFAFHHMENIAVATEETVELGILEGSDLVVIERIPSPKYLPTYLRVGTRLPVHCTSMGKAILAFMEEKEKEKLLNGIKLEPWTKYSICNKDELKKNLARIRKVGYAINDGELTEGVFAIGAPIFSYKNVVGAISVSFPGVRYTASDINKKILPILRQETEMISQKLGLIEKYILFKDLEEGSYKTLLR